MRLACYGYSPDLACVASVSVGFSARSRRFSLFGGAKIRANATLMEAAGRGRGGEKRKPVPFLPSPPPSRTFLRSPQFSRVQEAKNASNLRKALRKRLLRRLPPTRYVQPPRNDPDPRNGYACEYIKHRRHRKSPLRCRAAQWATSFFFVTFSVVYNWQVTCFTVHDMKPAG